MNANQFGVFEFLSLMVLLCLTIISTVDRLPVSKLDDLLIVYMYISFPGYPECGVSLNYAPLRKMSNSSTATSTIYVKVYQTIHGLTSIILICSHQILIG